MASTVSRKRYKKPGFLIPGSGLEAGDGFQRRPPCPPRWGPCGGAGGPGARRYRGGGAVQTGGVTTTGAGAVTTGGVTTTGAGAVTTGGVTTTGGRGGHYRRRHHHRRRRGEDRLDQPDNVRRQSDSLIVMWRASCRYRQSEECCGSENRQNLNRVLHDRSLSLLLIRPSGSLRKNNELKNNFIILNIWKI